MTKRFTTKNIICSNYCVWDTDDKPYGNDEVVDLLNEQLETIEELEKDNKEYIRGLDLSKATSQAWASDVRELREQNCQLEKENEQLKSRINHYDVALKELQDLSNKKLDENEQLKHELHTLTGLYAFDKLGDGVKASDDVITIPRKDLIKLDYGDV